MNKSIYLILTIFTLTISCNEVKDVQQEAGVETLDFHGIVEEDFYKSVHKDTIIAYDLGKYLDYNASTNYIAGISSSKNTPIDNEYIYGFSGRFNGCAYAPTKAGDLESMPFLVSIGNVPVNMPIETKTISRQVDFKSLYGTEVSFSFTPAESITKTNIKSQTQTLYVPHLIKITSPLIEKEDEMFPLCDYRDFIIKWNADRKNENGVLIAVEWTGTMIFGDHHPDAYIRRTDLVSDTGSASINPELFEGIPDTALCNLTLIRSNIENVVMSGYSYKLIGETHAVLPFILIREFE